MISTGTYQLSRYSGIVSHFMPVRPVFVRDEADEAEMLRRARIKSGDYLMTLATELERVADSLENANIPEAPELQRIVSELLYLERNYKIVER